MLIHFKCIARKVPELCQAYTPGKSEHDVAMRVARLEQIVERVREIKKEWEESENSNVGGERKRLRRLYIATNGKLPWVKQLKAALAADAGSGSKWESIASSRDLDLTREQEYISQAVDAAILEKAGVFLGNGFSSLTANVNLIRRIRGQEIGSSRFW